RHSEAKPKDLARYDEIPGGSPNGAPGDDEIRFSAPGDDEMRHNACDGYCSDCTVNRLLASWPTGDKLIATKMKESPDFSQLSRINTSFTTGRTSSRLGLTSITSD